MREKLVDQIDTILSIAQGRQMIGEVDNWIIRQDAVNAIMVTIDPTLDAIAKIAYSNAQNGADAMKMRNIATAILYPDKVTT